MHGPFALGKSFIETTVDVFVKRDLRGFGRSELRSLSLPRTLNWNTTTRTYVLSFSLL
jgi:hypothetical protein